MSSANGSTVLTTTDLGGKVLHTVTVLDTSPNEIQIANVFEWPGWLI